jgi:hypothetical protein
MRWAGHVAHNVTHGEAYRILVRKPEGKRQLGRHRHRCEDNIIMDLTEIVWESIDWMRLAQDREQWCALFNTVINFLVQ